MGEKDPKRDFVSIEEAAEQLGTTEVGVLMYLKHAYLSGREMEGGWQIDAESLATLCGQGAAHVVPLCQSHCGKSGGCTSCG